MWRLRRKLVAFTGIELPRGFNDISGNELRRRRRAEAIFREIGYRRGYDEVETPILESAAALPRSVFSVWNDNNFFGVDITDYTAAGDALNTAKAVLRPEGTLPVCRFVAAQITEGRNVPERLLYSIACYRNEPIEEVDGYKSREFRQLGAERLNDPSSDADAEVIAFAYEMGAKMGIGDRMRIRLNNVALFNTLCDESGMSAETKVQMQKELDAFSKDRALGNADTLLLPQVTRLSRGLRERWGLCTGPYLAAAQVRRVDPSLYELAAKLEDRGVPVKIDLSVVRGFNYYTGPVFQVDIESNGAWLAEVAGGGRYDRVIGTYLRSFGIEQDVPATGFAFGTERIVRAATRLDEPMRVLL